MLLQGGKIGRHGMGRGVKTVVIGGGTTGRHWMGQVVKPVVTGGRTGMQGLGWDRSHEWEEMEEVELGGIG